MCDCTSKCEKCNCGLKTKLLVIKHLDKNKAIIASPAKLNTGDITKAKINFK